MSFKYSSRVWNDHNQNKSKQCNVTIKNANVISGWKVTRCYIYSVQMERRTSSVTCMSPTPTSRCHAQLRQFFVYFFLTRVAQQGCSWPGNIAIALSLGTQVGTLQRLTGKHTWNQVGSYTIKSLTFLQKPRPYHKSCLSRGSPDYYGPVYFNVPSL